MQSCSKTVVEGDRGKLFTYLRRTTGSFDIESEEGRRAIHKKVYLLQELGLRLNYYFCWHAYGVYSYELTRDLYIARAYGDFYDQGLTAEELRIIDTFNQMVRDLDPQALNYYLYVMSGLVLLKSKEALKGRNPKIGDAEVDRCWKILERLGLVEGGERGTGKVDG